MTVFCTGIICICLICVIECLSPFILQQKLQSIATKYMYVIEKYGYLTIDEKNSLLQELSNRGFDIQYIDIKYPEAKKKYGELLELKLSYKYTSKIKSIPFFSMENKEIIVSRVSYSKI